MIIRRNPLFIKIALKRTTGIENIAYELFASTKNITEQMNDINENIKNTANFTYNVSQLMNEIPPTGRMDDKNEGKRRDQDISVTEIFLY